MELHEIRNSLDWIDNQLREAETKTRNNDVIKKLGAEREVLLNEFKNIVAAHAVDPWEFA